MVTVSFSKRDFSWVVPLVFVLVIGVVVAVDPNVMGHPVVENVLVEENSPSFNFHETDESGAGSLWRMVLDGNHLRFDASQDGDDFTPYETPLDMLSDGSVKINGDLEVTGTISGGGGGGFGDSTGADSQSNAFLKDHAYSAPTDGIVTVWTDGVFYPNVQGYVGSTTNPVGAGTLEAKQASWEGGVFISFPVPKGEYWEITSNAGVTIRWRAMGTLSNPVDQD